MNTHCIVSFLRQSAVVMFLLAVVSVVSAQETTSIGGYDESDNRKESANAELIYPKSKWLDAYPKHVGLTWGASAGLNSNYIWRGLHVAGPCVQADATVGYGGFFVNLWGNIGATDWTFTALNPEVDVTIGFSRWGLQFYYIHMYYFDYYADGRRSRFFDMHNYAPGGGGTTGEWRLAYRVSNQLPISVLVALRTFGRDGYLDENGDLKRAYSTYIELGYDVALPHDWTLMPRVGMTPAKSMYTGYQGDFAVTLVGLKLQKQWGFDGFAVQAFAHVMLNPWRVTAENLILPISQASNQKLSLSVGCSIGI